MPATNPNRPSELEPGWHLPDWPRHHDGAEITAQIKSSPEDFCVTEVPRIRPSGEGSHLWLECEKRGLNTDWLARELARCAGVSVRDVGYAGMKDRHAVTRQWFSIGTQHAADTQWSGWEIDNARIIRGNWNGRKLQRGTLNGNRFRIVVRQLAAPDKNVDLQRVVETRLNRIADQGVPNYFGHQRFGHGGLNVPRSISWLTSRKRLPKKKQGLYLSALRSYLFNRQLAERVGAGTWNRLCDGDHAMLKDSQSVFACDLIDQELARRCEQAEIHPAGCLPGEGALGIDADLAALLVSRRVKAAWRSFRLMPHDLSWQWETDSKGLLVSFELPAGAYATTVLRELVSFTDASISTAP